MKRIFRSLKGLVFGFDFFISYPSDGPGAYFASRLEDRLDAMDFSVYRDVGQLVSGDSLRRMINWGLRRTKVLIVVCTPEALKSRWIADEIAVFSRLRRRIIPVDIEGALQRADWPAVTGKNEVLYLEDSEQGPSLETLRAIQESFSRTRTNVIARVTLAAIGLALVCLGAVLTAKSSQAANRAEEIRINSLKFAAERTSDPTEAAAIFSLLEGARQPAGGLEAGLKIWQGEIATHSLPLHNDEVIGMLTGKHTGVTSVAADGAIIRWDLDAGADVDLSRVSVDPSFGDVRLVAGHADKLVIASRSGNLGLVTWKNEEGKILLFDRPSGHRTEILRVFLNTNSDKIATLAVDGRLAIWDATSGGHIRDLDCSGTFRDCWYIPGTNRIVALTTDGVFSFGEFGAIVPQKLPFEVGSLVGCAVNEEGVATSFSDGKIRFVRWDNHEAPTEIEQGSFGSHSLSLIADDQFTLLLASVSDDHRVHVWNLKEPNRQRYLGLLKMGIDRPKKMNGGRRLSPVKIFGGASSSKVKPLRKGSSRIVFSPDRKWLVTIGGDDAAYVWRLPLNPRNDKPRVLRGHRSGISAVSFSADSQKIITGAVDGVIRVWPLADVQHRIYQHNFGLSSIVHDSQGNILASSINGPARFVSKGSKVQAIPIAGPGVGGQLLASAVSGGKPWIVWKGPVEANGEQNQNAIRQSVWIWNDGRMLSIPSREGVHLHKAAFSQPAESFALGWSDGKVSVHNLDNPTDYVLHEIVPGMLRILEFSTEKRTFAWVTTKGLDSQSSSFGLLDPQGVARSVGSSKVTVEGRILNHRITASDVHFGVISNDEIIFYKGFDRANVVRQPRFGANTIGILEFSQDGGLAAVAIGTEGLLRIYDLIGNGGYVECQGRDGDTPINVVRFSPDQKSVVGGHRDAAIRIWKLPSYFYGQTIGDDLVLNGHQEGVMSLDFTQSGELMSGSSDQTLRFWPLEWKTLVEGIRSLTSLEPPIETLQ
jgi:WD40 repeat protein